MLNSNLLQVLACPWDHTALRACEDTLACEHGHKFAVDEGIPVFAGSPRREPTPQNMEACKDSGQHGPIDKFVDDWLVNTNGNLYWRARGRLRRYPIPQWPFAGGAGKLLVDVGCSWGRWTIAASLAGFIPIGLDVHMDALAAGGRVTQQMGVGADFVCGDADHLPFHSGSVDLLFSYSVLQHLERSAVNRFFSEAARVLKPHGVCIVQLPNAFGLYNIVRQLKRGLRDARPGTFEMRYWSRPKIRQAVEEAGLENLTIRTDGFFTQNPQLSDLDLLSFPGRLIVLVSHAGRRAAALFPVLTRLADSLWIEAHSSGVPR